MKVLIVDDMKENLYLLERLIKKMGYEVVVAENGKQALEKLHRDNFILVISDILMPVMDGFQLLKAVRSDIKFNDVLIIIYTASYLEKEDEELALDLGADRFVRKPLDPEKLIEIIKNVIQTQEMRTNDFSKTIIKEEKELLKLYSERLIHKLEQKMVDLEKAYNRAEFYKDLFSHDIKNILQSIFAGIQTCDLQLTDSNKLGIIKKNLPVIKDQLLRGITLVSNIHKFSKLDESEPTLSRIEISNILRRVITNKKNSSIEKKINIEVDAFSDRIFILANELIEDVFENLLINAVRYNKNPTVEIIVRISEMERKSRKYSKFEFLDNGYGIDDSRKKEIFQRISIEDKSVHGMGLGLSLVKKIIESYNGDIWVEDRVKGDISKGSNFVLIIPDVN